MYLDPIFESKASNDMFRIGSERDNTLITEQTAFGRGRHFYRILKPERKQ
jgi:hypothetical protein